jgi:hypothetical protein
MDENRNCAVCEETLNPTKDKVYIAQENNGIGGVFSGTKRFDAMDCPKCDCQNILAPRLDTNQPDEVAAVLQGGNSGV